MYTANITCKYIVNIHKLWISISKIHQVYKQDAGLENAFHWSVIFSIIQPGMILTLVITINSQYHTFCSLIATCEQYHVADVTSIN